MRPPRDSDDTPDEALPRRLRERAASTETRAVYRLADEAYAPFSCAASGESCQLATTGRQPWLWPSEWHLLIERARAVFGGLPPRRADGGCPFLDPAGKRCTVYADRPFGCRTFFCSRIVGPKRQPAEAVAALSLRLEALNQRVDSELRGPRPLLELFEAALSKSAR